MFPSGNVVEVLVFAKHKQGVLLICVRGIEQGPLGGGMSRLWADGALLDETCLVAHLDRDLRVGFNTDVLHLTTIHHAVGCYGTAREMKPNHNKVGLHKPRHNSPPLSQEVVNIARPRFVVLGRWREMIVSNKNASGLYSRLELHNGQRLLTKD